jgi:hypothetical protein
MRFVSCLLSGIIDYEKPSRMVLDNQLVIQSLVRGDIKELTSSNVVFDQFYYTIIAARCGHVAVLEYLGSQGCPKGERTCEVAKDYTTLKYLHEHQYHWDPHIIIIATGYIPTTEFDRVRYVCEQGYMISNEDIYLHNSKYVWYLFSMRYISVCQFLYAKWRKLVYWLC